MPVLQTNDQSLEGMDFKIAQNGVLEIDRKSGIVEAFAAVIGNRDNVNDIIMPGAFLKSLQQRHPRAVWHHSWQHPIGKVLEVEEVGPDDYRATPKMREAGAGGLYVKVQFNLNTQRGRDAFEDVAFFGKDFGWSIGYKTRRSEYDAKIKANRLFEIDLYEVSPVLHGANPLAETLSIKAEDIGMCDVKSCGPVEMDSEEKIGRAVAGRNMKRLGQAIEILQSIMAEGGVEEEMVEKSRFVIDFEEKSGQEFAANEVLVYGDNTTVKGVTLDVDVRSREDVVEVLAKANDLICSGGFLAQVPPSEEGGTMKFYFPGERSLKDGFGALSLLLEDISYELNPRLIGIGAHEATDSIEVGELFQEPESRNTDLD